MVSIPGKDTVDIFEIITKILEYHPNLVHKAVVGLRGDSNFKRSSTVKCYQTTLYAAEKSFVTGSVVMANLWISYFKKGIQPAQSSTTPSQ